MYQFEYNGQCPCCDKPLINRPDSPNNKFVFEACVHCGFALGKTSGLPHWNDIGPQKHSRLVWDILCKMVLGEKASDDSLSRAYQRDRISEKIGISSHNILYPWRKYHLTFNENFCPSDFMDVNSSVTPSQCECHSQDLFWYGCRCGFMATAKLVDRKGSGE